VDDLILDGLIRLAISRAQTAEESNPIHSGIEFIERMEHMEQALLSGSPLTAEGAGMLLQEEVRPQ
jgi:hypothetical protein